MYMPTSFHKDVLYFPLEALLFYLSYLDMQSIRNSLLSTVRGEGKIYFSYMEIQLIKHRLLKISNKLCSEI